MARPKNVVQENVVENVQSDANLTHQAFGIFQDESGWCVAQFWYDPKTGATGKFEKRTAGPGRDFAVEQLKIEIAHNLL